MDHKLRHKRVRLLVKKLNNLRKTQVEKTDILCNDLIAAQRRFIQEFDTVSFTANFYKSILGVINISALFYIAGRLIKDEIGQADVAFFLRQPDSFKLHVAESNQPITLEQHQLESCFTAELVDNICKANRLCTLENLLEMGLQGNPAMLKKLSAVTIPLCELDPSVGFILIYCPSEILLTEAELKNIIAVTPGLARAVQSCISFCRSEN